MDYTEKDLEKMLQQDEEVYANLLQVEKLLKDHQKSWTKGKSINQVEFDKLYALEQEYKAIKSRYEARQKDYKTNKSYQFGKKISKWVSEFTASLSESLGLNGIPLAIPVGYVIGAVLVVGAVAYFCGKYANETKIDFAKSLEIISEVSKVNPDLAEKMLRSLDKAKEGEQGIKPSTIVTVTLSIGLLILGYRNRDKIGNYLKQLKNGKQSN